MKTSEEVINEIMDYFNFEKVGKTMKALNWEWRDNGVPDIYEIKRFARQIMKECYEYSLKDKESKRLSSGGFYVFSEFEDGIFTGIELSFILESFDVFTD
jgi:hypothetical protein